MRLLEAVFKTILWKVVVVLLTSFLLLAVARLFITAHYAMAFYKVINEGQYRFLAESISDVYNWGLLAGGLLLVIMLAGLMDLFSAMIAARRFREVTAGIRKFAAGDFSHRVAFNVKYGDRDIVELGRAFNRMGEAITRTMEKLKSTDALRRELVANVAHDLGTPVTSIQGYVETVLLKENLIDPAERRSYLDVVLGNTKALSKLVRELFDLARYDEVDIVPQKEAFSIAILGSDVVSRFKPQADRMQVKLGVFKADNLPLVFADIGLIERALSNIVENALNFTNAGGEVRVSFELLGDQLQVSISDTGIGIPEGEVQSICDRYYRGSQDRAPREAGAGLGLAIVKKILDLHGSELLIDSAVNQGTRVRFGLAVAGEPK